MKRNVYIHEVYQEGESKFNRDVERSHHKTHVLGTHVQKWKLAPKATSPLLLPVLSFLLTAQKKGEEGGTPQCFSQEQR